MGTASQPDAIRFVVGWNNREAGPRIVDCSGLSPDLNFMKSKSRIQWPWFIGLFCLAAMANTYVPLFGFAYPVLPSGDGNAFSDRHRSHRIDAGAGRNSPTVAGSFAMANRRDWFAHADNSGLDSVVKRREVLSNFRDPRLSLIRLHFTYETDSIELLHFLLAQWTRLFDTCVA
jgi:hypothetical protein